MAKEDKQANSETNLILLDINHYDDIFSSFDSRGYSQKTLSDDFLAEIKRASADKPKDGIDLKFFMPKERRDKNQEAIIKKRLKAHFKRHQELLNHEKNKLLAQGMLFFGLGIIFMIVGALILFKQQAVKNFFNEFLIVFLEPGGWFLFWEGLNLIIFETKKKRPDLEFYSKMAKCEINFFNH